MRSGDVIFLMRKEGERIYTLLRSFAKMEEALDQILGERRVEYGEFGDGMASGRCLSILEQALGLETHEAEPRPTVARPLEPVVQKVESHG